MTLKIKFPAFGAALAATGLLLAAIIFGPNLALRLYLGHLLPRQAGLAVSCARAEAELWTGNRHIILENLVLAGPDLGRLSFGQVEISGLRLLNLLKARPGLDLAGRLGLTNILWEREGWTLAAPSLKVVRPRRPASENDLPFHTLDLAAPHGERPGLPAAPRFRVDHLALTDNNALLADLSFQVSTEAGLWTVEVKRLTLNGLNTALDRWLQSDGRPLSLLPEFLHLQMESGRLALDGRPALTVTTARPEYRTFFTKFSSEAVSRNYYLDFTFTPSALGQADPFWSNLAGLTGEPLDFELFLDLTLDPRDRAAQLRSLSLDGRNLGRLDLAAELSGLGPEGDTAAEWLAALFPARLHSLSLAFQDQGLMGRYYAWLAEVAGWDEAEVPDRLKAELLAPLAETLAEEGGLSNLPALAAVAEAFLEQPENIMISAEPARPPRLARLVKMERYDIIDILGLTLTINDQPPVVITAAGPIQEEDSEPAPPAPGRTNPESQDP